MLVLVVDTSGSKGSVALAAPGRERHACEIIECVPLDGGTFSAELVPRIAGLLMRHGFQVKQVSGFAVVSGPGSFTGLRIGLAAIKAFAEVTGKPIAAVSLLELLAVASGIEGSVLAAMGAGRTEFFVGEYELHGTSANLIAESLLAPAALLEAAAGSTVVTADKALVEFVRARDLKFPETFIKEVSLPGIAEIASLGCEKILAGQTVTSASLEANYIRRPDPELLREKQLGARSS
jgi:tRNA threonylcarbamoyladenosine biosynthesis protein TsaB